MTKLILYSKRWMSIRPFLQDEHVLKNGKQRLAGSDVLVRKRNSRFILFIDDKFHHDFTNHCISRNLKFESMGPKTWGRTVLVFDHPLKRPKNQYKLMKEKQKHKKSNLDDFYGKLSIIFKNKKREIVYKSGLENETLKELEPLENGQDIILLNDNLASKNENLDFGKTRIIFNRQGKHKKILENDEKKEKLDVQNFGKCLIKFDRKMTRRHKGILACKGSGAKNSSKSLINSRNYLDMLKSKDVELKNVLEKDIEKKALFISKKDKNWKPSATRIIMDKTKQSLDKLIMLNNDPQCGFVAGVQDCSKPEDRKETETFVFEETPQGEKQSKEEVKKFFERKYKLKPKETQKKKFTTLLNDPSEINAIASNPDKWKTSATRALLDKSKQNLDRLAMLNNDPRMGFTNSAPKKEETPQNLKKEEQSEDKDEGENIKNSDDGAGTSLKMFKTRRELSFKNFLNLLTGMKITDKEENTKEDDKMLSIPAEAIGEKINEISDKEAQKREEELKNEVASFVEPLKVEKEDEMLISVEQMKGECQFLKPEVQTINENFLMVENEHKNEMPSFESNAEIFDFMDQHMQNISEVIKDNGIEGFEVKAVLNSANDVLKQTQINGEIIDDIVKTSTRKVDEKVEEGSSTGGSELKSGQIQMKMNAKSDTFPVENVDRPKLRLKIEDDPKITTYESVSMNEMNEKTQSNTKSVFENLRNDFTPEPLYKSITKDRLKDYKDFAEKFEKMGLYKKQPKKMLNGLKEDVRKKPLGSFKRELEVQEKFKNTPEGKRLQEYFDSFRFKLTTSMKEESKRRRTAQEKKFFISTKLGKLNPPTSPSKPSFSRKSKDSDKPHP